MAKAGNIENAFILEGARSCLDAAGMFQLDAIACYRDSRYASAVVLGQIALEHLGQFRWLYEIWVKDDRQTSATETLCSELQQERRHLQMAKDGLVSFLMSFPPMDIEWQEQLKIFQKRHKMEPERLVQLRFKMQYVKPDEHCRKWLGPRDCDARETHSILMNVGNSHRGCLMQLLSAAWDRSPELAKDLKEEARRPMLLPPPEGDVPRD